MVIYNASKLDMKIKWRLSPYSLTGRWFRKKAEVYSEVFNINDC